MLPTIALIAVALIILIVCFLVGKFKGGAVSIGAGGRGSFL